MTLDEVLVEDKKQKAGLLSGIAHMLAKDLSISLNDDKSSIEYMHSYLEKDQVNDQSGDLYSSQTVSRYKKIALISTSIFLIIFGLMYGPSTFYSVNAYLGGSNTSKQILETADEGMAAIEAEQPVLAPKYEPPYDPTLSEVNMLNIPTAGIETEIHEAVYENYEDALRKGVWRVSYSGSPAEQEKPIILVAHRYGYLKWSIPYRLKNSFYNLPKAELGDTVEIIWRQRKYVYEIYAEEEAEHPSDFSADLILYTCKDLNSPIRVLKYARLVRN